MCSSDLTFPAIETHIVPSATLSLSKPWLLPGRILRLYSGIRKATAIFKAMKPDAVVGFGGYPSFPPLIAAWRLGIPSCVHDQNAMMGRANRVLSRFVDQVASSFPDLAGLPEKAKGKVVVTGNPVRTVVINCSSRSPATSSLIVSEAGIRVAGVPSRGENLKVKASSKPMALTALRV